jgi:phosphoglycerol transferase
VGAVGFLILLGMLWFNGKGSDEVLTGLSKLNLAAVLLATLGGFSSLFSILISPMIRGYNRISIFIAFFSLLAVCLLLDRFRKHLASRGQNPWMFRFGMCAVLLFGIWDQTPAGLARIYTDDPHTKRRWENDADFFARMESALPKGAMVFQYPHMNFPEGDWPAETPSLDESGAFSHMAYDQGRGYLHTKTLRWSFPLRGRETDKAFRDLATKPLPEQLKALAWSGFRGISIYRRAYADRAASLEANLTRLLGTAPLVSKDQTMSFYDMANYVKRLKPTAPTEAE